MTVGERRYEWRRSSVRVSLPTWWRGGVECDPPTCAMLDRIAALEAELAEVKQRRNPLGDLKTFATVAHQGFRAVICQPCQGLGCAECMGDGCYYEPKDRAPNVTDATGESE